MAVLSLPTELVVVPRLFVGVDPGGSGAIAFVNEQGQYVDIFDYATGVEDEVRGTVSVIALAGLEVQHSRHGEGVKSTFTAGVRYGWWMGVFDALKVPYVNIDAKDWQRLIKGLPTGKDSRPKRKKMIWEAARKRWPEADLTGPRGAVKDGRSDALWLAEFTRLENLGAVVE